jgi:hypothetical protein
MATTWPVTRVNVETFLGLTATATEQPAIDGAVAAAVAFVERAVLSSPDPQPTEVPADTWQGTVMLAARLFGRRGSALGVVGSAELGTAYVMRNDPDIGMLLRLNRPKVG